MERSTMPPTRTPPAPAIAAAIALAMTCAATAHADLTISDPGLYDWNTTASAFEARARADNGSSQTWKSAIWLPGATAPAVTGGNTRVSPWVSGVAQPFQLDFDAASQTVSWTILGRTLVHVVPFSDWTALTAVRLEARTAPGNRSTLSDLTASVDGTPYAPIPGFASLSVAAPSTFETGPMLYTTAPISTLSLRGSAVFDLAAPAKGDLNRISIRGFEATPIPTPGALALGTLSVLVTTRRRR